ncbi:NAD-dependent epimerase [Flavimobilis marinus]|uniref:NAD(P)-binding domain-containing protein n=1 Tax=Flavimobilis marinus TaxID=285351 RepID=A0A1I2H881_9MICO|nr:NAD(P)H-binding protein [Flavimobilis marinus]GHG54060.1 NAD-dependent epimerase [Flavimobilis marinus]SFF25197.1 hypothetical protein SAMN04488035_2226 [Flavimobilis marinus]
MAHIVVFGGTGFAGRNIVHEAGSRGHSVVVVSRSRVIDGSLKDETTYRQGDVGDADLVDELARAADVVVVATPASGTPPLVEAVPHLLAACAEHGARLGFVGGAGSLRAGDGMLLEQPDFPADYLPEARAHADVLDALRAADTPVSWFYLSPPPVFGAQAPGKPTGHYRLGKDEPVVTDDGESTISGADLAVALVDEIEKGAHHQARFTVGY